MTFLALFGPIQVIVDLLQPVLVFFHDSVGLGWGMSIVMLTVVVRALLVPLTVKQMKSMKAMAAVAPELKALQQKYKDDKQRQQQEIMKFYKENQVNPFASCLPLLAQLPFFLGLFYLLQSDLRHEICGQAAKVCGDPSVTQIAGDPEKFLFIPDLTADATGGVLITLILLYIGSQLLSGVFMSVTADRNQRLLIFGLPFIITPFIISFPAGLIVYWITTNLWTVGQGIVIRKTIGPITPPKPPREGPAPKGFSGFLESFGISPSTANGQADGEKEKVAAGGRSSGKSGTGGGAAKAKSGGNGAGKTAAGASGKAAGAGRTAGSGKAGASGSAKSAKSGSGSGSKPAARPSGPPPRSPRKKKKRSGRRR